MQSLWMVAASFLFACMGVCVKLASIHFSAAEIVFYRSAISLVLIFGWIRWHRLPLATQYRRQQFYRGLSGFVSLLLYFYGISMLPLATAVTLNYTSPLFLAVYMVAFAGIRLRPALVAAVAAGFLGVVLLLRPTLHADQLVGGGIALASGVLAGLAYFHVRALGAYGEPEWRTVFYFSLLSTIGSLCWMALFEFHRVDLTGGLLLLGVGSFATLAQLALTRAYKRGKALVTASLAYTAVVFASGFGMLIWGEHLDPAAWLAIALIVGSGMFATQVSRASPAEQD